jgi:diguanylate cyclase (GGDEF)-like protein
MARSRRSRTLLCLMYLDVDNFEHINDLHGHVGGDAVLKEFARRIKRGVRTIDMAARCADDEFVLLFEDVAGVGAAAIAARRILASLKPVFGIPGGALRVTASIGVALSVIDEEDIPALLAPRRRGAVRGQERRSQQLSHCERGVGPGGGRRRQRGRLVRAWGHGKLQPPFSPSVPVPSNPIESARPS